jgi:hypothetical protein
MDRRRDQLQNDKRKQDRQSPLKVFHWPIKAQGTAAGNGRLGSLRKELPRKRLNSYVLRPSLAH